MAAQLTSAALETYVLLRVCGNVDGRELYEDVRAVLNHPIVLYDRTPDSPYQKVVDQAIQLIIDKFKLKVAPGQLRVQPINWSSDIEALNQGLIPIPDPL